jgi:nucleoside-diphosphate-sugar epimerase
MMTAHGIRRVLVTGGAGYIGSVLTEVLLAQGYEVTVVDRFFFGNTLKDLQGHNGLRLVRGDVRSFDRSLLEGVDAVLDLAALSNDPSGELDPEKTMDINFRGRARVARLAREMGVKRYVLASSCSIYGFQDEVVDERSAVNPLTTYAKANHLAEVAALELADADFAVTVLRQATVYGLSRRMRFDLAINGMVLGLYRHGTIPVLRDGTQWRPMVHVQDTSRAFVMVLQAPAELVNGEIFNVGSDDQNFQILPLAERLAKAVDMQFRFEWYGLPDHRSYRVSFRKIRERLGFEPRFTPEQAARDILEALRTGRVNDGPTTRTVEWYRTLLEWHARLQEVLLDGTLL